MGVHRAVAAPARLRAIVLPVSIAIAGLLATLVFFYPGVLSNDAVEMYRQVASGRRADAKPPLFVDLWRLTDRVVCGAGGIFALHVALYWAGVLAVATGLASRAWTRALLVAMLGFLPPIVGRLPMVSVDNAVVAAWSLAVGLLLHRRATTSPAARRALSAGAFVLLAYGTLVRHNAITGVLPLLAWLLLPDVPRPRAAWSSRRAWLGAVALAIVLTLAAQALNRTATPTRPWALAPLWDVAAISVRSGEMWFPVELLRDPVARDAGTRAELERLEQHFSAWSQAKLLYYGDGYAFLPRNAEESEILARAWWAAVTAHPGDYVRHRGLVFLRLLAVDAVPAGAFFMEQPPASSEIESRCGGSRAWVASPEARATIARGLRAATRTPLYRTWIWAVVSLALLVASPALARRAGDDCARSVRLLAASGLLYVAPLALVAPAVELRYTLWLYAATAIAVALTARGVFNRRRARAQ